MALGLLRVAGVAVMSGDRVTLHQSLVAVRAGLSEAGRRGAEVLQPFGAATEPEGRHLAAIIEGLLAPALEAERLLVAASTARRPRRSVAAR